MIFFRRGRARTLLAAAGALIAASTVSAPTANAQDTTTTTTATSTTSSLSTTTAPATTTIVNPLGPIRPLTLGYDAAAGTIAIENPCSVGNDGPGATQETYDLFLVPSAGQRTQLAAKQSPYATVPAYQTDVYTIPTTLPHGTSQVLLQCQAPPLTIQVEREQFATMIDWQGITSSAAPTPASAVAGSPSFTG